LKATLYLYHFIIYGNAFYFRFRLAVQRCFYTCSNFFLPFYYAFAPDSFGKSFMFSDCPSAAFVRTDTSCNHDVSWTAWAISTKLSENILWPLPMTWLDSGSQMSKFSVAAGS